MRAYCIFKLYVSITVTVQGVPENRDHSFFCILMYWATIRCHRKTIEIISNKMFSTVLNFIVCNKIVSLWDPRRWWSQTRSITLYNKSGQKKRALGQLFNDGVYDTQWICWIRLDMFITTVDYEFLGKYVQVDIFTALHGMQTRYYDENSVRLSVRPSVRLSNACIVNKPKKNLISILYLAKDHLG